MAQSFTEYYCDFSTGANINAGDDKTVTTTTNGNYLRAGGAGGTDLFTATGGTPFAASAVNDPVSVYADGATVTTFLGIITAINLGGLSIDISLTKIAGTRPATGATGNSATVGGKFKGPNGASIFPFGFITKDVTNAAGNVVRVNFRNTATYAVTVSITHTLVGPVVFQGCTTTAGGLGKATIDGTIVGARYILFNPTAMVLTFRDFMFQNNGTSGGAQQGVFVTGLGTFFERCVVNNVSYTGFSVGTNVTLVECEVYACNTANGGNGAGIDLSGNGATAIRCISHNHTTANTYGIIISSNGGVAIDCIVDTVATLSAYWVNGTFAKLEGCVGYNSAGSGLLVEGANALAIADNCLFEANTVAGVKNNGTGCVVRLLNCAFWNNGANSGNIDDTGTITLGASGMVDPANGNFAPVVATDDSGRGAFTQDAGSYSGTTVSYPPVGAASLQVVTSPPVGAFFFAVKP